MKKSIQRILLATVPLLAFLGIPSTQAQSGFRVIVHPDNPVTSISKDDLSKLFLKKTSRWDDGTVAAPVDLGRQSSVREDFTKEIHGRSLSSILSFWQRQIFSGRGSPPAELNTEAEAVQFVKANRGAVGYVSSGTDTSGAKAISVTD